MPELPEVEALAVFLRRECEGKTVERAEVAALSALKTYRPPVDSLIGGVVKDVGRKGKYLLMQIDETWLVMHLARGGWVQWRAKVPPARARPGRGPLALRMGFSGGAGFDVTEQGTEKRLAIWLVADPCDVDGVGNAYSDEALHAAKMSPFKNASKLSEVESANLYQALVSVLSDAVGRSVGLAAGGLKSEKKTGLSVHGRAGEACPVCGDDIREVSFATKSLQYCPTCQTGGKPLADRRMSRLLK